MTPRRPAVKEGIRPEPAPPEPRHKRLEDIDMRKIVAGLFLSLDGVMESPEEWTGPYMNDEMGQAIGSQLAAADAMLLGRRTYQTFAAAFSDETHPMATQMNSTPKFVVSTTLATADWRNSTLIKGDVVEEVTKLKQQPGKNIVISGSPTLVRSLLRDNLLDELNLLVPPIVLGSGRRLFEDGSGRLALKLVDSKTFSTGVLSLTYAPAGA
jgi:dihydrofolate reductase